MNKLIYLVLLFNVCYIASLPFGQEHQTTTYENNFEKDDIIDIPDVTNIPDTEVLNSEDTQDLKESFKVNYDKVDIPNPCIVDYTSELLIEHYMCKNNTINAIKKNETVVILDSENIICHYRNF